MELDGAGDPVREYAYYPGIDQPNAMRRASDGAVFRYTQEQPGHVSGLVGAGNVVVNKYAYTPWGEPIATQEQVEQPLRYAAREYDAETGLYFVRARYYDPQQGRFLSEDPIGVAGGLNLYAYSGSDPVNFIDPFGLCRLYKIFVNYTTFLGTGWVGCTGDRGRGYGEILLASYASDLDLAEFGGPTHELESEQMLAEILRDQEPASLQCWAGRGLFAAQLVADATLVYGLGVAAFRGVVAGSFMMVGSMAARSPRIEVRLLARSQLRGAVEWRASATVGAQAATYDYFTSNTLYTSSDLINSNMAQQSAGFGEISWMNFVPGFATWDAYNDMKNVCAR